MGRVMPGQAHPPVGFPGTHFLLTLLILCVGNRIESDMGKADGQTGDDDPG